MIENPLKYLWRQKQMETFSYTYSLSYRPSELHIYR